MADTDSSSAQKPHVYDLLYRLNQGFGRVRNNMAALAEIGIFDPLMMQLLNRQAETLRAAANSHLSEPCAALKNATASSSRSHPTSKT
jgi:hypothetical protein